MNFTLWIIVAAGMAWGQHNHGKQAAGKPVDLLTGLGKHSHPIATSSPEAQRFFDQGLALLYGFNHDEAARMFSRAAELDPASPMPHWGIAYALGPNYNLPAMAERESLAWQAIEKALQSLAKAPMRERAYVEALALRYSKDPAADRTALARKYTAAMKLVMQQYPDDLDAATLYAESMMNLRPWQLWNADGTPAEGTNEICAVLEGVLRRDPSHPGANHYYIHAVEASPSPERALASAARLETLVPGAGHLVHMPSHIYARVGEFDRSALVNEKAAEADEQYLKRSKMQGMYPLSYYSHNLHFVAYSRMMQGRYQDARKWAQKLRRNVSGAIDGMPMIAAYGAYEWLVLVRFGRWEEMLREKAPTEKDLFLRASYHYARGAALAGLRQTAAAEAERIKMDALAKEVPADAVAMFNPARQLLALASVELAARIAGSRRDTADELKHGRRAVELEDALGYMEPPDWYYPMREYLGGALLRAGKAPEAENVFRKDLERNPRNGRSLHGLREALRAQGKTESLAFVEREFRSAWQYADTALR